MKDFWKPKKINFKPMNFNMKPIKVKPMFGISNPVKFSNFGINKNPVPRQPDKNLTYPQAKRRYSGLSPFGDWDRDNRLNMFDCRPFDFFRHKVPQEYSERRVPSYSAPSATFASIFKDAEEQIPDVFTDEYEDEYSEYLTNSLLGRSELKSSPFKDIVGIYSINIPSNVGQTSLVLEYIDKTLSSLYPNKEFVPIPGDPTKLTVFDYDKQPGEKGQRYDAKISDIITRIEKEVNQMKKASQYDKTDFSQGSTIKYLEKTIKELRSLMTQLVPHDKVKVWITDYPVDILRKSTRQGWRSCERLDPYDRGEYEMGPFSDVENWNAVAYFYMGGKEPKQDNASARVMLRWGRDERGKPEIGIERDVYPLSKTGVSEESTLASYLIDGLQEILRSKGYGTREFTTDVCEAYSDIAGGSGRVRYRPYPRPEASVTDIHAFKRGFAGKRKVPKPFIPFMMRESDIEIVKPLARQETLPSPYVSKLSRHPVWSIRSEVAKRKELPEPVISRLAEDPTRQVKTSLLTYTEFEEGRPVEKFRELPRETIKKILSDTDVAYDLACRTNLSDKLIKLLAGHKADQVRRQIARRSDLPDSVIKKLSKDKIDEVKLTLIYSHPRKIRQMPEVLESLARGSLSVKRGLLKNISDLPDNIIKIILKDADVVTKQNIASVSYIPTEVALFLSKDKDAGVLYNLMCNGSALTNMDAKDKQKIISNILPTAISKSLENVLGRIARKHYLTSTQVKKLLDYIKKTKDKWTCQYLASNSSLPGNIKQEVFSFVVEFGDKDSLYRLIENSSVPDEIREVVRGMI